MAGLPIFFLYLSASALVSNSLLNWELFPVNETLYFFYVSDDKTLVNDCLRDLKEFGFDFKKLKKVTNEEILNGILTNKNYFVIDGDYLLFVH